MWNILFIVIVYFIWTNFFGDESGCEKYASKYSCKYVEEKANYDVYYWINFQKGDEQDNKLIGSAIGLSDCQNLAIGYANQIKQPWDNRSYICMLIKDGRNMEKHRY